MLQNKTGKEIPLLLPGARVYYMEVEMTIHEFQEYIDLLPYMDYLVKISYIDPADDTIQIIHEILIAENGSYSWLTDWNEGYHGIYILNCIPVSELEIPTRWERR